MNHLTRDSIFMSINELCATLLFFVRVSSVLLHIWTKLIRVTIKRRSFRPLQLRSNVNLWEFIMDQTYQSECFYIHTHTHTHVKWKNGKMNSQMDEAAMSYGLWTTVKCGAIWTHRTFFITKLIIHSMRFNVAFT